MDYSSVILNFLKDENIKKNLNPVVYYCLKLIYDPNFKKRNRYFSKALKSFFESLGNTLNISLFEESVIEKGGWDKTMMNETLLFDLNPNVENNEDNLNISINKDFFMNMSTLMCRNWDWSVNLLFESEDEYILDKDDDYVLLKMIKNYIFTDEDPKTSQLLLAYNIFSNSIELIFCLKLVENFPKSVFNPRELNKYEEYTDMIKYRIKLFYGSWCKVYKNKFDKNILIRDLIGKNNLRTSEEGFGIDLISLSMVEPLLNSKYISFTKLIREGPFCFEIEEVARQICIIDHELMSSLKLEDYNKFIIRKEIPESFNKFNIREKQLKSYILLFILMHNNLENKKNMIQNFISLAYACKILQNHQTSHTIISAFNIVGLSRKKLLWKLIEKKYREIYSNLEKDYNEMELNDNFNYDSKNFIFPTIPHISGIKNQINNFIIKIKSTDQEDLNKVSKEYKDFYLLMEELSKNKFSFFIVNPLYDFFKFGFLEFFKPKKWNLKLRIDFSHFTDDLTQLDQLLEFLIANFKKLDN